MAPSCTDQRPSFPAHPDKSLPLKSDSNSAAWTQTAKTHATAEHKTLFTVVNSNPPKSETEPLTLSYYYLV